MDPLTLKILVDLTKAVELLRDSVEETSGSAYASTYRAGLLIADVKLSLGKARANFDWPPPMAR